MARQLAQASLDPQLCDFSMIAIGPLFPEQSDFVSHAPIRDSVHALERTLAEYLRARGYQVIGIHASRAKLNEELGAEIVPSIDEEFPPVTANLAT